MEPIDEEDPFLNKYQPSDLKIASEFLTTWLPFLSRDLCKDCVHVLSHRIRSLEPEQHRSNTETVNGEDKRVSDSMVENMESEEIDNNVEDDCDGKFCNSRSLGITRLQEIIALSVQTALYLLSSKPLQRMRTRWSRHSLFKEV